MKKLLRSSILWLVPAGISSAAALLLWRYALADAVICGAVLLLALVFFALAVICAVWLPQMPAAIEIKLSGSMEEALKAADFSARNVMVGTVRTPEQLRYCMEQHKYYAPAKYFLDAPFPLDCIALHEEEIGTEPGIRWVGKILSVELVERSKIPVTMRVDADPGESYYHFTVESWQQRRPAITILGSRRGRPRFTSKFLLEHCTKSYQLFAVTNEQEYRLMYIMEQVHGQLCSAGKLSHPYRLSRDYILMAKDSYVLVIDSSGWVRERFSVSSFVANPVAVFFRVKKLICK